jgi:V-type H+-transporting ATPase subunit H
MALARDESKATQQALPLIFSYLSGLAKSTDAGLQDIAVQEYSAVLFGHVSRQQFWNQRSETIGPLVKILQTAAGIGSGGNSSASLWSGNNGSNGNNNRTGFEGSLGGGVGLQLLYHVLLVMWQISFEAEDIGDELNE